MTGFLAEMMENLRKMCWERLSERKRLKLWLEGAILLRKWGLEAIFDAFLVW